MATGSTAPAPSPKAIMYVVAGQGSRGLLADIWASDTMGRQWHKMNADAPFGPRADVACAVLPSEPLGLLVGGGVSSDLHRDLWLSRDGGETFASRLSGVVLPPLATLLSWPGPAGPTSPLQFCCAAHAGPRGHVLVWRLLLGSGSGSLFEAVLEPISQGVKECVDDPCNVGADEALLANWRPPSIAIDLVHECILSWDPTVGRLVAHGYGKTHYHVCINEVALPARPSDGTVHILCDMDSVYSSLRRGALFVLVSRRASKECAYASSRSKYTAQRQFLRLLEVRLSWTLGIPSDLFCRRLCSLLLPPLLKVAPKARKLGSA